MKDEKIMYKPHKRLDAWKRGMELTEWAYRITAGFPKEERYGLVSQMRRAAASIPANIAEGAARRSKKEFIQFLHIARGSLSELDTFMDLAERLGYVGADFSKQCQILMEQVDCILAGLLRFNVSRLTSPVSRT